MGLTRTPDTTNAARKGDPDDPRMGLARTPDTTNAARKGDPDDPRMGLTRTPDTTSAWPGSRLGPAGVTQPASQPARGRVNATTMAATAPVAPAVAMTRPGANRSAAARPGSWPNLVPGSFRPVGVTRTPGFAGTGGGLHERGVGRDLIAVEDPGGQQDGQSGRQGGTKGEEDQHAGRQRGYAGQDLRGPQRPELRYPKTWRNVGPASVTAAARPGGQWSLDGITGFPLVMCSSSGPGPPRAAPRPSATTWRR